MKKTSKIRKVKPLTLERVLAISTEVRSCGLPHDLEDPITLRTAVDVLEKARNQYPELVTFQACYEIARAARLKEKEAELRSEEREQKPIENPDDPPPLPSGIGVRANWEKKSPWIVTS